MADAQTVQTVQEKAARMRLDIVEMIGAGPQAKGAVWVARRLPDGMISAHANMARIGEFPRDPDDVLGVEDGRGVECLRSLPEGWFHLGFQKMDDAPEQDIRQDAQFPLRAAAGCF